MFYFKENIKNKNSGNCLTGSNCNNQKYVTKGTRNFNRIIFAFFFSGFSTFSILYCIQPILPTFSLAFHLTPYQSSLSLSIATASMAFGMLFIGLLSDVFGRKIVMSFSLLLSACFTILCAFMNTWIEIIIIRFLIGFSISGAVSVAMTYLSEEINPEVLPFAVGLYISGNTLGGVLGRFLSSTLINYFSWDISIMVVGILCLLASIIFVIFLPSSRNFRSIPAKPDELIYNLIGYLFNRTLFVLFITGFVLMGSFVTLFNYIGYRLMLRPFFWNQIMIGCLSIIYLSGVYSSTKASSLILKYSRKGVIVYSFLMMIFGILITQSNVLFFIISGLLLFSCGFFAAHSIASSWVGKLSSAEHAGQASSLYLFFYYLGSSILGTCSGFFWSFGNWSGISAFILCTLIIGFIMVCTLKVHEDEKNV